MVIKKNIFFILLFLISLLENSYANDIMGKACEKRLAITSELPSDEKTGNVEVYALYKMRGLDEFNCQTFYNASKERSYEWMTTLMGSIIKMKNLYDFDKKLLLVRGSSLYTKDGSIETFGKCKLSKVADLKIEKDFGLLDDKDYANAALEIEDFIKTL